ncbi:unnamed protein product, partial [Laminaria digitata]
HPPVFLVFENPINGSTVQGDAINLSYTLRAAGRAGRLLTGEEVKALQDEDGVTMCFIVERPFQQAPVCAPLSTQIITIDRPLPGTWTTVTAKLHASTNTVVTADEDDEDGSEAAIILSQEDAARGSWDDAGDSVSVLVALEGLMSSSAAAAAPMCGENVCLDSSDLRSAYFDRVYRDRIWGKNHSGPGSTVPATNGVRRALEEVLRSYRVTSMLDAPCGDLRWMPLVRGIENVRYTGADISSNAVQENQQKFPGGGRLGERSGGDDGKAAGTNREAEEVAKRAGGFHGAVFVEADLVEEVPPSVDGEPYNLVFLRDLMLHLPPEHNLNILKNVEASGAKLLMASTYLEGDENWSSNTFVPAKGHPINLSSPPYCLRPPVALYEDIAADRPDQRMGLWVLDLARPLVSSGDCDRLAWG